VTLPAKHPAHFRLLLKYIPGLRMFRDYSQSSLLADLGAGLVLTAILIPIGMSYADASGLPAIYGLYSSIIPLLVYALFGPSRIMVLGPDSALAGLMATALVALSAGSADKAVALAAMLAIMVGTLCFLAGLLRLGFITELLSKPIRYGYLNGIALTVLASQLPKLCGMQASGENLLQKTGVFLKEILHGQLHLPTTSIGVGCLLIIWLGNRYFSRWPVILITMLVATVCTVFYNQLFPAQIAVIGRIPQGLPGFHIPDVSLTELQALLPSAAAIALVAFADMSVLSRTYAQRLGDTTQPNQELVALGLSNVASGLFHGFAISSSASRTPVAEAAGAKTQMTNVIGALSIALVISFSPQLLQHVPRAVLAAIVIAACISLVEIKPLLRLYRIRRSEFWLSMLCFMGVAQVDVIHGIFIAVVVAVIAFLWRAWRPYDAVLGRIDGLKGYHDIARHPEARQIPGLLIFRWDAPLFFANQEIFRSDVQHAIASANTPTRQVLIAAEPVTDIDVTAADMLQALELSLSAQGIGLCFAELKGPVKDRLKDYGLMQAWGEKRFFPTIGKAVDAYVADHQVQWVDWED
jgi:high affinity sulfate transporter 1